MMHVKVITLTVACNMYKECVSGVLNPDWEQDTPISCLEYRQRMGEKVYKYRSADCNYSGDDQFCNYSKLNKG